MTSFVRAPKQGFSMGGRVVRPSEPSVKPKRYLVFTGEGYYPAGGWNDFKGSADTIDDAQSAALLEGDEWWQVIDMETGEEVGSGEGPY